MNRETQDIRIGLAEATYTVIKASEAPIGLSFMITDTRGFTDLDIVHITLVKSHQKGCGRKILEILGDQYTNNPILLKAEPCYASLEEYNNAKASGEFQKSLEKLADYYKSCGFININEFVGYENGIAFIYGNSCGKEIAEKMLS